MLLSPMYFLIRFEIININIKQILSEHFKYKNDVKVPVLITFLKG
jgi:hypothetical protein